MFTTEQINTIAQVLVEGLSKVSGISANQVAPQEERYIIFIGKKPRKVKAPYIAINADGQLSGFTSEDDVLGTGTDRIGKFTKGEVEARFPQFNHPHFLVRVPQ